MFLDNMLMAGSQVAILYTIVLIGFICDKTKIFTETTARKTTNLLMYMVVPIMIVNSFLKMERTNDNIAKFFLALLLSFATHAIAILINTLFFRKKDEFSPIYKFASVYGNVGYMALPLAQALLGAEGLFYCSTGVVAFYVAAFTHGTMTMSREKEKFNLKKIFINPGILGVAAGLPLFLLDIDLPRILAEPVQMISNLNTPVGMLIFGTYLANTDLLSMFTDKKIYKVAFLKLLVMPLVCIGVYSLFGVHGTLLTACAITASVPSAGNTFMFASIYGRDTGVASKTTALVSFISILTMPLIIAIAQTI